MADDYLIVNLSDGLGYIVEDLMGFLGGFLGGWMLILTMLMLGVFMTLYWRFFRNSARSVAR